MITTIKTQKNKNKKNTSSVQSTLTINGNILSESTANGQRVPPLDCNVYALPEKRRRSRFTSPHSQSYPHLRREGHCLRSPCPERFDGERNERIVSREFQVFALFRVSAPRAADPAAKEVWLECEGARVSGHVKSHRRHFPCEKGMRVAPSGLLPSPLRRCRGSSSTGMSKLRRDLAMTSSNGEWWAAKNLFF